MGSDDSLAVKQKWYRKFLLLMWKNLLVRKRHWLLTLFEILLPFALFLILVLIRVLPDSDFLPEFKEEITTYDTADELYFRQRFCLDSLGVLVTFGDYRTCEYRAEGLGVRKILYGPPNDFTDELITRLTTDLMFPREDIMNVSSIQEMDDVVDQLYVLASQEELSFDPFYVGIFFHLDNPDSNVAPRHLKYDLRKQGYWNTDVVFPYLQIAGPRDYSEYGSYAVGGFTFVQALIDRHFTAMVTNDDGVTNRYSLATQMYPYPPYIQDEGASTFYGLSLPTFVVLSFVLLSPTLIKSIVHEKETGVRELIRLMGMDSTLIWVGWFCYSFITTLIITASMVFFLKIEVYSENALGYLPPILIYTDWFLLWVILLLYGISSIAFCFAVSSFFNKPTLATTIGILFWILSYFIPRGFMDSQYDQLGLAPKIISCFLPNMSINWAFRIISMFEGRAVGMQWNNLWETGNPRDELTMGMVMIMLVTDIVLYFLITWYVDKVKPGTYGVPQPWNFFLKPSYWNPKQDQDNSPRSNTMEGEDALNHEPEPVGLKPGITITNLRKTFPALGGGTKVAVDDVSFKCFEGECTVLLGHNGAGKTTTMSVITGIYPATGGTASIFGYDIHTHLDEARAQVGLCPQHNTLFADLTVEEHLMFFARLKGCTTSAAKEESKALLKALQLTEKKTQFGDQLSGGMKRKLCLCLAMVGGSKVVILDEPSSGLDPESRRWVWNTVQRERSRRTVLVTTHHMEEADVLGDRIAIMASGRVVSSGSTLFLKKRFGDGYSIRVLPMKGCQVPILTSAIKSFVPTAKLTSDTEEELVFSLGEDKTRFPALLEELSTKKELLKVNHVGLSQTTMEQVFLRVGEEFDATPEDRTRQGANGTAQSPMPLTPAPKMKEDFHQNGNSFVLDKSSQVDLLGNSQFDVATRLEGFALRWERIKSLWIKRIIYSKRKWVLLLTQGLVPVLTTLLCLMTDLFFFGDALRQPRRDLNLSMFEWTMSYVEANESEKVNQLGQSYINLFSGNTYQAQAVSNLTESLITKGLEDEYEYRENYVASALFALNESGKIMTKMMYQSIPFHAPGVGMNLVSNAILQEETGSQDYLISTYNYPLPYDQTYRLEGQTSGSALTYAFTMPLALAFLSSSFLVFPLQERMSKAKQIQIMTGTSPMALWFTSFTWDIVTYNISAILVFIFFMALDPHGNFTLSGGPGALYFILFMYGWCSIPMAYLFSFAFSTAASGFGILTLLNIVAGMIMPFAVWGLNISEQPGLVTASEVLGNVSSLFPSYPVWWSFKQFLDTSTYNTQCDIIDDSAVESLCRTLTLFDMTDSPYFPCCPQCSYPMFDNITCFTHVSYFDWEIPGLGRQFVWMFGDGLICLILLALIEAGFADIVKNFYYRVTSLCCSPKKIQVYKVPVDDDVVAEAQKAQELMQSPNPDTALVVEGLTKEFLGVGLTAVDHVSFGVSKGECFGLLGVNGAGKTTTFRMLTGDEIPSAGDARIGNKFLSNGQRHFVREIGYCPQFDAILDELTGEETLNLLAGLRGVPRFQRKAMMKDFIELVDLTECYKRQTRTYSGGNKRKLSTAMALVGAPALVFLDEPTTGVDPASRRRVWMAIRAARANGQSIILTSHSMDECEALCNRIVILVRGQLRCAGSPGHLKAKFSQGHSLQIKLRPDSHSNTSTDNSEDSFQQSVSRLQHYVANKLPGAHLVDQHRGMLSYLIPPSISWATLFSVMEALKDDNSDMAQVEDYSATEPSLEQVFLAFAREADMAMAAPAQYPDRGTIENVTVM